MQAAITPEFLANIPEPVRRHLDLAPGQLLDFDKKAPYLKAVPVSAPARPSPLSVEEWLKASTGLAAGFFTTAERMNETRDED